MSLGNCGCVLVSKADITSDKINGVQYEHIFYISVKCICTFTTENFDLIVSSTHKLAI